MSDAVHFPTAALAEKYLRENVPEAGQRYIAGALASDPNAVNALVSESGYYKCAYVVSALYALGINPPAFRVALTRALTQKYHFSNALRVAGSLDNLRAWCRFAETPLPPGLPLRLTVHRGGAGLSVDQLHSGLFWSTDFDCASAFAMMRAKEFNADPMVMTAVVPREAIVFFTDYTSESESEVILDRLPNIVQLETDTSRLRIASGAHVVRVFILGMKTNNVAMAAKWATRAEHAK